MNRVASQQRPRGRSDRPALRVLSGRPPETGPSLTVLVAGADAYRRAVLRAELASALPRMTRFCEAEEVGQVLEHAPHSRLVVLASDLRDSGAESLMRLLSQRHPELAVVCVDDAPVRADVRVHC